MLRIVTCFGFCLVALGCEEKAAEAPKPKEKAIEVAPVKAEPKAEPAKPAAASTAEKAQAEVEANPLTKCCRALGQRGFMKRSPDYMAASKVCGESMKKKESVAKAMPAIKKSLGKEALPAECN